MDSNSTDKKEIIRKNRTDGDLALNEKQNSDVQILDSIGHRVSDASPEDADKWIEMRGRVLEQNADYEDRIEKRYASRRQQIFDTTLRFSALGIGAILVSTGHFWIGGFIAAAGVYGIAKDFVTKKFPTLPSSPKKEIESQPMIENEGL